MARYWLMKSEPETYSISDLKRDKTTGWSGVRNFAARNHMRAMRKGDLAFFYHSSADPSGVAGVMEVAREAYPDPTQFEKGDSHEPRATKEAPVWFQVDARFVEAFPRVIAAAELKAVPALKGMALFKYGRLSVQPVTAAEWKAVLSLKGS